MSLITLLCSIQESDTGGNFTCTQNVMGDGGGKERDLQVLLGQKHWWFQSDFIIPTKNIRTVVSVFRISFGNDPN